MAGRLLILEFEDADSANSFAMNENMHQQLGAELVGMYVLPTKFCECPDKRRQNSSNWKRGSRTGLQVCVTCKRPSTFHQKGLLERIQYLFGYNQLPLEGSH